NGELRCIREVRISGHGYEVGRRFRAWPRQFHILSDRQLNTRAKRGFDGRLVYFAITLRRMAVSDLEQRPRDEDWNEKRAAGNEFFVVEIAGVAVRRIAAHAALFRSGRHPHASEKRTQRHNDSRPEFSGHVVPVERNDLRW